MVSDWFEHLPCSTEFGFNLLRLFRDSSKSVTRNCSAPSIDSWSLNSGACNCIIMIIIIIIIIYLVSLNLRLFLYFS